MTDTNPFSSPAAQFSVRQQGRVGKIFGIIGLILCAMPFPALVSVTLDVADRVDELAEAAVGDPELFAGEIALLMTPFILSLVLGIIGLITLLCVIGFSQYRAKWFFWAATVASVFYLLAFPVGTILSIIAIIALVTKKDEYLSDDQQDPSNA